MDIRTLTRVILAVTILPLIACFLGAPLRLLWFTVVGLTVLSVLAALTVIGLDRDEKD